MSVHPVAHTWPENWDSLKNLRVFCIWQRMGTVPCIVGSILRAWCVSCLTYKEVLLFSWVMGRVVSSEWHSTCACFNGRCTPHSAAPQISRNKPPVFHCQFWGSVPCAWILCGPALLLCGALSSLLNQLTATLHSEGSPHYLPLAFW